jgi:hypothetical protein
MMKPSITAIISASCMMWFLWSCVHYYEAVMWFWCLVSFRIGNADCKYIHDHHVQNCGWVRPHQVMSLGVLKAAQCCCNYVAALNPSGIMPYKSSVWCRIINFSSITTMQGPLFGCLWTPPVRKETITWSKVGNMC